MKLLAKLNAYTKKQPITLLSVAFVLLVLLVLSNVLVFLGLVQRESILKKVRKYLMVMRRSGIQFSEDMTNELKLDVDEVDSLAEEAAKVKAELVSEGMEEEPEEEVEEETEEEVEEVETEEEPVEAFSGEVQDYSSF
jgi:hypothetical protein